LEEANFVIIDTLLRACSKTGMEKAGKESKTAATPGFGILGVLHCASLWTFAKPQRA